MNTKDLAKYLYDYAMANYEKSGWSVIVETMELADIEADLIEAGATTKTAAKKSLRGCRRDLGRANGRRTLLPGGILT